MESAELFKKAVIGGFDKTDVMNYFEKTQKKHREEVTALKSELAAVRQQESALQDQCDDQSETIGQLTLQLREMGEETEQISGQLDLLRKKNEELQRELSAQKALNTQLQMKKNVLEENLRQETTKNEELQNELADITARFAERTGIEIGELLIQAKINARKIVEKAKADAEEIRTNITSQCGEAKNRFSGLSDQLGGVEENFRAVSEETIQEIEQVRQQLAAIQGELDNHSEEAKEATRILNADQSMIPAAEDYVKY